jgi:hypothetical protein
LDPYKDEDETLPFLPDADLKDAAGKPFDVCSVADALINAEVMLPSGDSMAIATVVCRGVDNEGRLIGTFNDNPLLNTLLYECEFEELTLLIQLLPISLQNRMQMVTRALYFMK